MDPWLDFAVLGLVALLFFIACTFTERRSSDALRLLLIAIPTGTVLGLVSDLVLWGTYTYPLGYGLPYLTLNAAVVYGLFVATVLLLQKVRLLRFLAWILAMAFAYEVANYFFPTWSYEVTPFLGWLSFVILGYFATAVFVAFVAHLFWKYKFAFVDDLLKR